MRSFREFAEQIAAVQELGAMMKRILAGVISNDPAGVDDDRLYFGPCPEAAPPSDVITNRVLFGDVRLSPAVRPAIPGHGSGLPSRIHRDGGDNGRALFQETAT